MNTDDYFAWRNVSADIYLESDIPAYLKPILNNTELRVLDFGCGYGQLLLALKRRGFSHIEGADVNAAAIGHARNQELVVHDVTNGDAFYSQKKAQFDYVVMSHVLEHFRKEEIIPQLRRIRELLDDDGGLIVMVPNAQSHTGCYWAYEDFTHNTLFTAGSLYYVLKAAGFSSVEFIDVDCTAGARARQRIARRFWLSIYRANIHFWNWVTASSFHRPSAQIFSFEIKALARG